MGIQLIREARSRLIHKTLEEVIYGTKTTKTAAVLLGYHPNYIYELIEKFDVDNDYVS